MRERFDKKHKNSKNLMKTTRAHMTFSKIKISWQKTIEMH